MTADSSELPFAALFSPDGRGGRAPFEEQRYMRRRLSPPAGKAISGDPREATEDSPFRLMISAR